MKPCSCGKFVKGEPFVLGRDCKLCWLYEYSEPHRSVWNRTISFAAAFVNHVKNGMVKLSDEAYQGRLAICDKCPTDDCDKTEEHWKCKVCHCQLREGVLMPGKARWGSEDCPKGHWPKIELPVVDKPNSGCGNCQKK